jgi:hypothetical protein
MMKKSQNSGRTMMPKQVDPALGEDLARGLEL